MCGQSAGELGRALSSIKKLSKYEFVFSFLVTESHL